MSQTHNERLDSLFSEAVELPAARRKAFLDKQCGKDSSLRREIDALLDCDEAQPENFLNSVNSSLGSSIAMPQPGTLLDDRYTLTRVLGEGGMGVVYLAQQDHPSRTVALKLIRAGVTSQQMLRRFELETQVLGRLNHPGIAQIFEASTFDDGTGARPFFAMEYVDGVSLNKYIDEKGLNIRSRLGLFTSICEAVNHAHQKGIIHRDLKPGNILITATGQPKILDFGVARATDSDLQITTRQTDLGQLIGTLPYMSPEQVEGRSGHVDGRSDVYALGVILYEMLASKLPYDLGDQNLAGAARVISEVEPSPLSTISRVYRGDLSTITLKALEKDPQRRYQSAADLAADVKRYLNDEPIVARRATTFYQLRKFTRRNKALAGGMAIAMAALFIGTILASTQAVRATRATRLADSRKIFAEEETAIANAVNDFLSDMLGSVMPDEEGGDVTVRQVLDDAAQRIDDGTSRPRRVEEAIRMTIAKSYLHLSQYEPAEYQARICVVLDEEEYGHMNAETAEALQMLGMIETQLGRYDDAEKSLVEALRIEREVNGPDHLQIPLFLESLAALYNESGRVKEAEPVIREGLEMQRRLDAPRKDIAYTLIVLSGALFDQNRMDEAETAILEALEINRDLHGEHHNQVARCLNSLAIIYSNTDRKEKAVETIRQTIDIERGIMDPDHMSLAATYFNLGMMLRGLDRLDEAEVEILNAQNIWKARLGDDHPYSLLARAELASMMLNADRVDEAEPILKEVLEKRLEVLGEDHLHTTISMTTYAGVHRRRGHYDLADPLYRRAFEARERMLGPDHPRTISTLNLHALNTYQAGDFVRAETLYGDLHERRAARIGEQHRNTLFALQRVAESIQAQGRYEEIQPMLEDLLFWRRKAELPNPRDVGAALHSLGFNLLYLDRFEEAEATLTEALDVRRAAYENDANWRFNDTQSVLGAVLIELGRFAEAEPLLLGSAEALQADAEAPARHVDESIARLMDLYERWGRTEEASAWREQLILRNP
ncbi:MAG: serine/threonine-protein kinase [Planctomycetota bacterium]|nr:serine/threonine-protein kinase [Planctomycetota bacterium]